RRSSAARTVNLTGPPPTGGAGPDGPLRSRRTGGRARGRGARPVGGGVRGGRTGDGPAPLGPGLRAGGLGGMRARLQPGSGGVRGPVRRMRRNASSPGKGGRVLLGVGALSRAAFPQRRGGVGPVFPRRRVVGG